MTDNQIFLKSYLAYACYENKIPPDQEQSLLIAAKHGDQEACNILCAAHTRLVISIAKRYKKTGDPQFPDLIQSGYIGIIHAIHCFKWKFIGKVKFSNYAYQWIRKEIRSFISKNKLQDFSLQKDDSETNNVELIVSRKILLEKVRDSLSRLPQKEKDVLELSFGHELSHRDIAKRLGVRKTTVTNRKKRAKRMLRKKLYRYGITNRDAL